MNPYFARDPLHQTWEDGYNGARLLPIRVDAFTGRPIDDRTTRLVVYREGQRARLADERRYNRKETSHA